MNRSVIVTVPVYKPVLDAFEQFSLDLSIAALHGRELRFIGPATLDRGYYGGRYPQIPYEAFPADCFASIAQYNRLLLSPQFYQRYAAYEFLLILQTDAIVLRDELDHWCAQAYDYVGAPWPNGVEILVNAGAFAGQYGKKVRAHVGNGGLSLRRNRACIDLLAEFPDALDIFTGTGSSEDLYFSILGGLSQHFRLPNEMVASGFALELGPSYYFAVNGGRTPMGGHAWWKYEPEFWRARLPAWPVPDQAA